PLKATIVDPAKPPRTAQGQVEYTADFYILRPVDLAKGNGAIFYEASNRGNKAILARFNYAAARSNDPSAAEHAGDGFLMRHGFTLVWNGWMPGLPSTNNLLQISVPSANGLAQTTWDALLLNDAKAQRGPPPSPGGNHKKERPPVDGAGAKGQPPPARPRGRGGFRRRAHDPPPPRRHAVPHRHDLSDHLSRREPAGERHRLCV